MSTTSLPIVDGKLKVKAVGYADHSTPLTCKEVELPITAGTIVKPTELLVNVKATSINPVDCVLKAFAFSFLGAKHKIPGGDFAGIVVKAGAETNFNEGDKIYGDVLSLTARGSFSDYILFDTKKAVILEKIPEGMTFEEAGSLPIASGTSYQCLKQHSNLKGSKVLVLGAGTSVGTYTVQMAKHYFHAGSVVVTCSANSAEKSTQGGADVVIDYTKGEKAKIDQILDYVKANGKFDIIVDTVRDEKVFDYADQILKPATEGGVISQVEGSYTIDYTNVKLSELLPSWRKLSMLWKYRLGLSKVKLVSILLSPHKGYGEAIDELYTSNKLKFSMDSTYDAYTEAQKAFEKVASGKAKGKVVLRW